MLNVLENKSVASHLFFENKEDAERFVRFAKENHLYLYNEHRYTDGITEMLDEKYRNHQFPNCPYEVVVYSEITKEIEKQFEKYV